MELLLKRAPAAGMKTEPEGYLRALFAPFLSVDRDSDVTLPGAFGDQPVLISAYGHASWSGGMNGLPVGKGRIHDGPEGGVFEGHFFLDTFNGSETFKTVAAVGELQEFSYALPEIEAEKRSLSELLQEYPTLRLNGHSPSEAVRVLKRVRVPEICPVLMGSGVGTRVLEIKSCGRCASRCSRLAGGACCHEADSVEVLRAVEEQLRKTERLTLQFQVKDLIDRSLLDAEITRFFTTRKKISDRLDIHYVPMDAAKVDPALRRAAEVALKSAWSRLGAFWPVKIRWLAPEPEALAEIAAKTGARSWKTEAISCPVRGFVKGMYGREIFLVAENLSPGNVGRTVAHELAHLLQHRDMSREYAELDAQGSASEYISTTL